MLCTELNTREGKVWRRGRARQAKAQMLGRAGQRLSALEVSDGTAPLSISLLSIRALWADGTTGSKSKERKIKQL